MKKLSVFLLLGVLVQATSVFAYRIKMQNNTPYDLEVFVTFGGPGVCASKTWALKKGELLNKTTGICCTKNVEVTVMGGPKTGAKKYHYPPRTGAGLSCKNWGAELFLIGDDNVVIENRSFKDLESATSSAATGG